jgi:hypothetical protein
MDLAHAISEPLAKLIAFHSHAKRRVARQVRKYGRRFATNAAGVAPAALKVQAFSPSQPAGGAPDTCLPTGAHLTLTSEYRGYRWRGLTKGASLQDKEGFFPATAEAALERIDPSEARAECHAQIEVALLLHF